YWANARLNVHWPRLGHELFFKSCQGPIFEVDLNFDLSALALELSNAVEDSLVAFFVLCVGDFDALGFLELVAESVDFGVDLVVAVERSEEHTSELQSRFDLVCRLLLEKKKIFLRSLHDR